MTIGGLSTRTNVSETPRRDAARAAQSTATFDAGEPSVPTTIG